MAKSTKQDVQFIGVGIDELLAHTDAELKSGQFDDGTRISPPVREALTQFTNSLRGAKARPRHYVFVWSRHIFIKIDF